MSGFRILQKPRPNFRSWSNKLTLNQFFKWCNANTTCALHDKHIATVFDTIVSQGNTKPAPAPGCKSTGDSPCHSNVTGEEILFNVPALLRSVEQTVLALGWIALSEAIAQAAKGNATLLLAPGHRMPRLDTLSSKSKRIASEDPAWRGHCSAYQRRDRRTELGGGLYRVVGEDYKPTAAARERDCESAGDVARKLVL